MANLSESATWTPGVYQLEETDVVQGGPDGIDNEQAKALANRTTYLKQEVELRAPLESPLLAGTPQAPTPASGNDSTQLATTAFVANAIAAILNAPPGTLDTLNELAAALGDDPNFATTVLTEITNVANSLATHAGLASTETQAGHIKLATLEAVLAGLETQTAVSPATLFAALQGISQSTDYFHAQMSASVGLVVDTNTAINTFVADGTTVGALDAGRFIVPADKGGLWIFTAQAHCLGGQYNTFMRLLVNDAIVMTGQRSNMQNLDFNPMVSVTSVYPVNPGDEVFATINTQTGGVFTDKGFFQGGRLSR